MSGDECQLEKKKRRYTTRSRSGCTYCKRRRIRCDEKRPECTNCANLFKSCCYGPAKVPLRDRRAQGRSGDQEPWVVQDSCPQQWLSTATEITAGKLRHQHTWRWMRLGAVDPFDSLPIMMPLRSKELLHYFYQAGEALAVLPKDQMDDCMASAVQDPFILRHTLLIAGVHYAWNVGDLRVFESTFLSHKIQSIQMVNQWLNSSSKAANKINCANHIITLSLTECCLGNFDVAEAHLQGLTKYMDSQRANEQNLTSADIIQSELTNRYLILAYNIVHSLKSRLDDFLAGTVQGDSPTRPSSAKELAGVVHQWHVKEATGLAYRLKSISLFPFFFSPGTVSRYPRHVDVSGIIYCLRDLTDMYDARSTGSDASGIIRSPYELWDSGGPSRLLSAVVNAHLNSLSSSSQNIASENHGLVSSWSGFSVAIGMYLTTVLGIWNNGTPAESLLLYHILLILKQDLQTSTANFAARNKISQALWFWKWFTGALTIVHAQSQTCDKRFEELSTEFLDLAKNCGGGSQQSPRHWQEVKALLHSIIWPVHFERETEAILLWNDLTLASFSSGRMRQPIVERGKDCRTGHREAARYSS